MIDTLWVLLVSVQDGRQWRSCSPGCENFRALFGKSVENMQGWSAGLDLVTLPFGYALFGHAWRMRQNGLGVPKRARIALISLPLLVCTAAMRFSDSFKRVEMLVTTSSGIAYNSLSF